MALSKKISTNSTNHPNVEKLILKGGTSGAQDTDLPEDEDVKRVQLRVPTAKLDQINKAVRRRPGRLSRHTWIMEAIEEKLQRDNQ
jgi:hypothetical protein